MCITIEDGDDWRNMCRAMGDPAWSQEDALGAPVERYRRHDEIDEKISLWTKTLEPRQVMLLLQEYGLAAGPGMAAGGGSHERGLSGAWSVTIPMSLLSAIHWYFLPIRSIHAGFPRPGPNFPRT